MTNHNDYLCETHKLYADNAIYFPLSPCRYKCETCKEKKISGYTNPDHVSNPFGYCYVCPTICVNCSLKEKKCMWC
jgi:hypothetical protein